MKLPFGLDIGSTTTKAVWLDPKDKGFILKSAIITPTPAKGMLSESPIDEEQMAQALKKLVVDAKIGTPYVNIALEESQVYTRVIEMPVLSDKELESAIYWEAEQYIPVPLTSTTIDHVVLNRPEKGTGTTMDVLLVGAPTHLLDKYQKIVSMAGLVINAVETEILSTIRALVSKNPDGTFPPSTLVISIGAISTSIAIVRKGITVFTYSIPTGGAAISRAIASDFGFTLNQAEEYKKLYGLSEKNFGGKLGKATEPILNTIVVEVKRAVSYYTDKYKESEAITQILLSGGTANLPGLELYFAKQVGIETAIANPWKALVDQAVPRDILDKAVDYTVAVGLAMRGYDG